MNKEVYILGGGWSGTYLSIRDCRTGWAPLNACNSIGFRTSINHRQHLKS